MKYTKFKIGDKVKININYPDKGLHGLEGEIISIGNKTDPYPYDIKVKNLLKIIRFIAKEELDLVEEKDLTYDIY